MGTVVDETSKVHGALEAADAVDGCASIVGARAPRKSSARITLVLIGAAALGGLAGCGNLETDQPRSRDVYASIEDCRADWGNPGDCEEIQPERSATGHRVYYGPRYYSRTGSVAGYSPSPRVGSRATGTVSSTPARGGFGASAARHGSSSSAS